MTEDPTLDTEVLKLLKARPKAKTTYEWLVIRVQAERRKVRAQAEGWSPQRRFIERVLDGERRALILKGEET